MGPALALEASLPETFQGATMLETANQPSTTFPRNPGHAPKAGRRSSVLCWLAACWLVAAAGHADWLVTRAGERIETEGGWEVKGRMVVFTQPTGTLASVRLSEIDLDASQAATADAAPAPARPAPAAPAPAADRPSRVITTDDVGEGVPGVEGGELLVERLRQAHAYKDVGMAMGLVNWQDVPEGMRNYIRTQFEWMMERRIRNLRYVAATPEELEEQAQQALQDDVLYEPNVEVAGKLEVEFIPDPDQAELALTFQVGTRLGSYFIAAPREVPD